MNISRCILVSMTIAYAANASAGDDKDLAKASQNPLGNVIGLPFENNYYTDTGPTEKVVNSLLIKPVVPMRISDNLNLISRAVIPITYIEGQDTATVGSPDTDLGPIQVFPGTTDDFGLGNISYTAFFSPSKPGKLIWGVGPMVELPTNSDDSLGSDTWSAGGSVVLLTMPGNWVVGLLASNIWDVASSGDQPDINRFNFQPIVNYNLQKGWYLSSTPVLTANWEAESGEKWSIPVGGGVGRLMRFGDQPVDFKFAAYKYTETPEFGPNWDIQLTVKFLLPK
jgi:hypothetical protein